MVGFEIFYLPKLVCFGNITRVFRYENEVYFQMKKSQTITLVILFIAVSLFIWIGACSDEDAPKDSSGAQINSTATSGESTPTAGKPNVNINEGVTKPSVDYALLEGLSTDVLPTAVSKDLKEFSDNVMVEATKKADCYLTNPGKDSKDIYMSFMLHYSDKNPYIQSVLDMAKEKNISLSFFMSTKYINDEVNADTIKRIYSEGHTIGLRGPKDEIDQIKASSEALFQSLWEAETKLCKILGKEIRIQFYSPDEISERNMKLANLIGYTVIFRFSTFVTDEGSRDSDETFNGVLFQIDDITDERVSEVTSYVDWAKDEGYTFKSFSK